jgi:hypothetical protein
MSHLRARREELALGDELQGTWTEHHLKSMDAKFCERMSRALQPSPPVARAAAGAFSRDTRTPTASAPRKEPPR